MGKHAFKKIPLLTAKKNLKMCDKAVSNYNCWARFVQKTVS